MLKSESLLCSSCRLKSCPVYSCLNGQELQEAERSKQSFSLKKGAVLFSENEPPTGLAIVRSGLLKVYKSCHRGPDLILGFAGPGDVVDLASYRSDENSVSARALCDTQVCFFGSEPLTALLSRYPGLALEFLSRACRELGRARDRALDIAYHPAAQRFAQFLLYWEKAGSGLYLSREEMAQAVGCSLETLIRLIASLRKKGVLRTRNKRLIVVDPRALIGLTRGRVPSGW